MNIKCSISIVQLSRGRGTAEGSKGRAYFAGVQTPPPQSLAPNSGSEFVASRRLGSPPRGEERDEESVPFYETNPFFWRGIFSISSVFEDAYVVCRWFCKWVRSEETNPFFGGIGGVAFIEKWVRFRKTKARGCRDGNVLPASNLEMDLGQARAGRTKEGRMREVKVPRSGHDRYWS